MPNDENVGQQLQSYLPGMTPGAVKAKKPHQMTPEEFAAHPYAVFHSSHLPTDAVLNPEKRPYGGGIHVGTEQAALERHVATSSRDNIERHTVGDPRMKSDGRLHTFWHAPTGHQLSEVISDWQANNRDPKEGPAYYKNDMEDRGSTSLVTNQPESLKTHGEYVRQAIKAKKGHEVPAKTIEMYRQGALDKGAWLPRSTSLAHTTPYGGFTDSSLREDFQSIPEPLDIPHSSKFSEKELDDFHGHDDWWWHGANPEPRPRVSNNGPNIERMRAQLEQDGSPRA